MSNAQKLSATCPHSGPRVSPSLTYTRAASTTLSLSTSSHGGASPSPPPLKHPPHRWTPENDTDELHHLYFLFLLGARSFPKLHLHLLLPLPQASSKKDDLELHQALHTILKSLPVFHSLPVSSSPPRSITIALDLEAMKFSRAFSPWMT